MAAGLIVFETERLVLRRLTPDDAAFVLRLVNQPDWLRYIGDRGVRSLDDARAFIDAGPVAMYAREGHGLYLVVLSATGDSVGICGLLRRKGLDDVDLGFAILSEFQRCGYALEAASAVLGRESPALGLSRVVAITAPENHGSAALLEKLGFHFESVASLSPDSPEVRLFAIELGVL